MSAGKSSVSPSRFALSVANGRDTIRRTVLEIIQQEADSSIEPEQLPRSFGRLPIEIPFRLLPVALEGNEILMDNPACEAIAAVTRDVSFEGMSFEHHSGIKEHVFVAFFPALEENKLALLFERLWSNKTVTGQGVSGGRFVGVVTLEASADKKSSEAPRKALVTAN
jgi:hypothetical protein